MKKFIPHFIWIAGLGTIFVSIVIGGLLGSGIPYQDATPAQAARQSAENGFLMIVAAIGFGLFVIGVFWSFVRGVLWIIAKIRS